MTQPSRTSLMAAALLIVLATALAAQQPAGASSIDALMGAAMHQEEVEGNPQAAAAIYKKVLVDPRASRGLQATALLRLAKVAEKLAPADARTYYQRLTREFSDQALPVAEAARRMASLTTTIDASASHAKRGAASRRHLWTKYAPFAAPSRTGRYIAFIEFDQGGRGSLHVRDLSSGAVRQLVKVDAAAPSSVRSYPGESRFTRDESRVAYAWKGADGYQLRVVGLDGTGERTVTKNPEHEWLSPIGWSADNSRILVKINSRGETGQIAWVTVASGEIRVLKSVPWTSLGNVALSDDGKNVAYDADTDSSPRTRTIFLLASDGSRQVAATDGASREEVIAWTPDGSALAYLSFRGGNPELWSMRVGGNGQPTSPTLVTRDMQGVRPLGLTNSGALIYTQIVSRGTAYIGRADWAAATIDDIRPISTNLIADLGPAFSPDGKQIAYVAHRGTDLERRFIAVYTVEDGSTREVVPAEDMTVAVTGGNQWTSDGTSYVANGAGDTHRRTYAVDLSTGRLRTLLTIPNGFAQNPQLLNGDKAVLYHPSEQFKRTGRLVIHDFSTNTDRELEHGLGELDSIGFNLSPDEQSVAIVPFVPRAIPSSLYVAPISGGNARRVVQLDAKEGVWLLDWTRDSKFIIYTRGGPRGTSRGVAPSGIWMVPAAGGEPRRLQIALPNGHDLAALTVHPDGKQVAFTISGNDIQLWSMDNVVAPAATYRR